MAVEPQLIWTPDIVGCIRADRPERNARADCAIISVVVVRGDTDRGRDVHAGSVSLEVEVVCLNVGVDALCICDASSCIRTCCVSHEPEDNRFESNDNHTVRGPDTLRNVDCIVTSQSSAALIQILDATGCFRGRLEIDCRTGATTATVVGVVLDALDLGSETRKGYEAKAVERDNLTSSDDVEVSVVFLEKAAGKVRSDLRSDPRANALGLLDIGPYKALIRPPSECWGIIIFSPSYE